MQERVTMPISRLQLGLLCVCLAANTFQSSAIASAQSEPVTEPKDSGIFYLLDSHGKLISLEFEPTQKQGNSLQVKVDRSPVRFPADTQFRLVARLAAGTQINFLKNGTDSGYRVVPFQISNRRLIIKPDSGAAIVHVDTTNYGGASIMLTPKAALDPGEYCVGVATGHDAYCFGVDAVAETVGAPTAAPATSGSAMTNADVIKLAGAGLSDEVIISSINRTSSRNFDLSVDGLIALKKAHVSDTVISAMNRNEEATTKQTGTSLDKPGSAPTVSDAQIPIPPVTNVFYLVGPGGVLRKLEPLRPTITKQENDLFEGNQVFYRLYGAHSPIRVTDPGIALVIKLVPKDNKFHALGDNAVHDLSNMYYRRFESVEGARQAMVSARNQRRGRRHDPDPGEFEFSITKLGADFYKVVPRESLIPGEYCVNDSIFTNIEPIYCFGLDATR